jgi:AraC-like DNA-binding protein
VREVCLLFAGPLIRVTDVTCRAPCGDRGAEEHTDVPELVLPRRGVFAVHHRGQMVVADPMTAVVLRGEYRVSHPYLGGDRCLALTFPPDLYEEALGTAWVLRARQRMAIGCELGVLGAEEQAMRFLADLAGTPRLRNSARIDQVRELLAARMTERWTLPGIAREVHLSPYHLARQFRAATGQTIAGYLTGLRLAAALDRIQAGEDNLARVAADLGFVSHSHLTERFRSRYGVTPSEVRKILTAGN